MGGRFGRRYHLSPPVLWEKARERAPLVPDSYMGPWARIGFASGLDAGEAGLGSGPDLRFQILCVVGPPIHLVGRLCEHLLQCRLAAHQTFDRNHLAD